MISDANKAYIFFYITNGHWEDFPFLSMWPHLVIPSPGITESQRLSSIYVKVKFRVDSNH